MKGLLQEGGSTSSARVAMMMCVITGCGISALGVWKGSDLMSLGVLVGALLGAGIGGKVHQKNKEK